MDSAIINYYNGYNEEGRLFRDNSHKVEWITTMTYFEKLFSNGSFILDGCAGTGNYSFKLAELGHKVIASDIVPHNVEIIKEKQNRKPILEDARIGDITDLSQYGTETFDVVLCMGAFYHLENEGRNNAIIECMRVLKPNGILVISYINNMAITIWGIGNNLENMDEVIDCYNNRTRDCVFLHSTPEDMEKMAADHKATILAHVAADGIPYFLSNKVNSAKAEDFDKFMKLHLMTCEDKSTLGYSLHGLLFIQK
jgi:2-polyprenyl-3-methyl-5-hydroxy-6-metoxy-1,4-benzoquinol methylase